MGRQIFGARRYLEPLLERGVDTLILGCTHYPLLAAVLGRIAGAEVTLVDSAAAVAEAAARELGERQLAFDALDGGDGERSAGASAAAGAPGHHLCVTDNAARFARIAHGILGPGATLELVEVG